MLELRNISKSYPTPKGKRYVFRNLNFKFPDDVSVGIMGPNGAGKSTLLRILGGLDSPDSGEVVSDLRISWPVGMGGTMQGSLTARDNVKFVCRIYGMLGDDMKRIVRFVEEFSDIGDYFDLPTKTYSSGMKSRVSFGLSMAFDFDYYLIDEAMAAGDPKFRRKSKEVFQNKMAGAKMLLVSHQINDIKEYCDVVLLVGNGQVKIYEDVDEGIEVYQGKN